MPTLEGTIRRLELNQSSKIGVLEELSGEKITFPQGLACQLRCALFIDTPGATTFVNSTELADIDSIELVVRKNSPNGGILFVTTTSEFDLTTSYATWVDRTKQQFTLEVSAEDTTQNVPSSGRLPIYFSVTVSPISGDDYLAGFGYGEIVAVGYISNPDPQDYVDGRFNLVGGKLGTNLDLNGHDLINSGDVYTEEGSQNLDAFSGETDVEIEFNFEKPDVNYRFGYIYVQNENFTVTKNLAPFIKDQTVTGFTVRFATTLPSSGCTLFWRVVPIVALPDPAPSPRFGIVPETGDPVLYQIWDKGGQFFNLRAYGGIGDGASETEDTDAFQAAADAVQAATNGGAIFVPAGRWNISNVFFDVQKRVQIVGVGRSSEIVWTGTGHLFEWDPTVSFKEGLVKDITITPGHANNVTHSVFYCAGGAERTSFQNVHTSIPLDSSRVGTVIDLVGNHSSGDFVGPSDTVYISDCVFWAVKKTGIRIGPGSRIFIQHCTVTGDRTSGSKAVHVTGGNGGVEISDCDFDAPEVGIHVTDEGYKNQGVNPVNPYLVGSNREIFQSHVTLDSCAYGLLIEDASYNDVVGIWAASCLRANIQVNSGSPILTIVGGTIYNAGVGGPQDEELGAHGLVVNSGSFSITSVRVRNNKSALNLLGKGIWVPNFGVTNYTITGCEFEENYEALNLDGENFTVTGNVFANNVAPNDIDSGALNYNYTNNIFIDGGNDGEVDNTGKLMPLPSTGTAIFGVDIATTVNQLHVAINAVVTPFGNANNFSGRMLVNGTVGTGNIAEILTGGTALGIVYQTGTSFSAVKDTSSKVNFYVEGSVVKIQNKLGVDVYLKIFAERTRNTQ